MARARKTIKLDTGSVYQKEANGVYFFRYQVNGQRKAVSLHTKNQEEALDKAKAMLSVVTAPSIDVVAAHVKNAKGWSHKQERLELNRIWEVYSTHPDRVHPKSMKVWKMYQAHLQEFLDWLREKHPSLKYMDEIRDIDEYGQKLDTNVASEFAEHLKTLKQSVDTYTKKIARVGRIFRTLEKYLVAPSPWENKALKRSRKEEIYITEHRSPFPPDKEKEMFEALKPESSFRMLNKHEMEVLCYILKYTGQRQKDCVNLAWSKISMPRRRLWVKQEKTGKDVSIPIAPELYVMLEKAAEWKEEGNDKVLPKSAERYSRQDKDGADTGVNLINKQILNLIEHVGLTPSIPVKGRARKMTIYGVHSFRHGFASHCAETGVPRAVCSSILGADASIINTYYVHIGEEAQEKAIMAFSSNHVPAEERIKNALAFIENIKSASGELLRIANILKGKKEAESNGLVQ